MTYRDTTSVQKSFTFLPTSPLDIIATARVLEDDELLSYANSYLMPALTFIFALNHHRLFAIFNHHGCLHSSANVTMSRAMSKVLDRMAAHHEAGHAVACVIFGTSFEYVRLDRDGSGNGAVFAPGEASRAIRSKGLDHDRIRRCIVCQIAGPFAQDRFKKIYRYRHRKSAEDPACNNDWKSAAILAFALTWTDDDLLKPLAVICTDDKMDDAEWDKVQAIMEERAAVAEKLVADHWSSVQAVAEVLLERGRLTYAEVRALVHTRDADRKTCNRRLSQPLAATLNRRRGNSHPNRRGRSAAKS